MGATPTSHLLASKGRLASPVCGQFGGIDDLHHRLWECCRFVHGEQGVAKEEFEGFSEGTSFTDGSAMAGRFQELAGAGGAEVQMQCTR